VFSWEHEIGLEGDDLTDVPLLPYEQSLLMRLLTLLISHPAQYLTDLEDVDMIDFEERIDNLLNRLSIND
jgi:hypothetical protein